MNNPLPQMCISKHFGKAGEMSRGDAVTLSLFIWEQFSIQTFDVTRLKDYARDLLDSERELPFIVRQAAERAVAW
jgi:hypothetical protein